jgi:hypothetical protein
LAETAVEDALGPGSFSVIVRDGDAAGTGRGPAAQRHREDQGIRESQGHREDSQAGEGEGQG